MLFQTQIFLPTTSVFHGLLSMIVGVCKFFLSRLNDEIVNIKHNPYVKVFYSTIVTLHLPLSRDSRNELQFCSLLKYSLLKQRGYYISEKKCSQIRNQPYEKRRVIVFHNCNCNWT